MQNAEYNFSSRSKARPLHNPHAEQVDLQKDDDVPDAKADAGIVAVVAVGAGDGGGRWREEEGGGGVLRANQPLFQIVWCPGEEGVVFQCFTCDFLLGEHYGILGKVLIKSFRCYVAI